MTSTRKTSSNSKKKSTKNPSNNKTKKTNNNNNTSGKNGKRASISTKENLKPSKVTKTVPFDKIKLFLDIMELISAQTDPVEVALVVIEDTCKVLDCDRTSFFFVDGDYLDLVIGKGTNNIRLPKNTGFAGKCATTGEVLNIADAYKDNSGLFNPNFDKKSGYRTTQILCSPVKDPDDSIVGVLQAINKNNNKPFDLIDQSLFCSIAKQVGISLRYAEQREQSQKAVTQKNSLISYIKAMNMSANATSVLFALNKAASELLEADRCTFYTVDQANQQMSIISADSTVDITLPIGKGIAGTVAKYGKTINIKDAYKDNRFDQSWDKKTGYVTKSMLVMAVYPDQSVVTTLHNQQKTLHFHTNRIFNRQKSKENTFSNYTSSGTPTTGTLSPIPSKNKFNESSPFNNTNNINNSNHSNNHILNKPRRLNLQLPCAVVQLINKKDDMENGYFTKDDEELLGVLLRFIAPIVSNSSLFKTKKKKTSEMERAHDIDRKHIRQVSSQRSLLQTIDDNENEDEE